jgi:CcmD family protein
VSAAEKYEQLRNAVKYVAAAYIVVFVAVLAYVAIIGAKLQRLTRELAELTDSVRARAGESPSDG